MRSDSHGFALIDTNILYYAFQLGEVEKHRIAQAIIEELDAHGEGCLSTQVLLEFSAIVTRKTKDRHDEIARVFSQFSAWTVHQPTPENILAAVALGERCQISIWDSSYLTV